MYSAFQSEGNHGAKTYLQALQILSMFAVRNYVRNHSEIDYLLRTAEVSPAMYWPFHGWSTNESYTLRVHLHVS